MTIVLRGKTKCPICGRVFAAGEELVGFPPFVANTRDPLIFFSDAGFHRECFEAHPLSGDASARFAEVQAHTGPGKRKCVVCGQEILSESDYLGFGHLTADVRSPLYRYNYTDAHKSHLPTWVELARVVRLLDQLSASGEWGGDAIERLVADLRTAAPRTASN